MDQSLLGIGAFSGPSRLSVTDDETATRRALSDHRAELVRQLRRIAEGGQRSRSTTRRRS